MPGRLYLEDVGHSVSSQGHAGHAADGVLFNFPREELLEMWVILPVNQVGLARLILQMRRQSVGE